MVDKKSHKVSMGPAGWMSVNPRTTFQKIVRRAALQQWPRLFHNPRASRETELVEIQPVQVVTSWLVNAPSIAMRHYPMTTDEHFEAARKAARHSHARERGEPQTELVAHEKTPALPGFAGSCENVQVPQVAGTGTELPLVFQGKTYILAFTGDVRGILASDRAAE